MKVSSSLSLVLCSLINQFFSCNSCNKILLLIIKLFQPGARPLAGKAKLSQTTDSATPRSRPYTAKKSFKISSTYPPRLEINLARTHEETKTPAALVKKSPMFEVVSPENLRMVSTYIHHNMMMC